MTEKTGTSRNPASPVNFIDSDARDSSPEPGIALCLSGGGYRAMVFHLGALLRLNEAGLLPKLKRVSSVSGGSITAGLLGLRWRELGWDSNGVSAHLIEKVIDPIRALAGKSIDAESIIIGIFTPGTISDKITAAYDEYLFKGATLQDLPSDAEGPRFVINATNVQSGALCASPNLTWPIISSGRCRIRPCAWRSRLRRPRPFRRCSRPRRSN